jgi:hypothetical protein
MDPQIITLLVYVNQLKTSVTILVSRYLGEQLRRLSCNFML